MNTVYVLIFYIFHFNIIPHLVLRLPGILDPVSPPQLYISLPYTVPAPHILSFHIPSIQFYLLVRFIALSPALNQATKTHSPTYKYGFKRTVACHTLNSGLTEQTLYQIRKSFLICYPKAC